MRGAEGKGRTLSPPLRATLSSSFSRGEQALLFINRRGYASLPLCLSCGTALKCPNCSLSLTLHGPKSSIGIKNVNRDGNWDGNRDGNRDGSNNNHDVFAPYDREGTLSVVAGIPPGSTLICHGCGHRGNPSQKCPSCGHGVVRYMGTGTEKLLELLEKEYGKKGVKLDADSTRKKGGFKGILESFGRGEADFMVGTQMAAKGHDFPNLTAVGVVDADLGLNLPDFRAAERTHQLLSQVSGRAGRADKPGVVIIQSLNPDHYAIVAAARHDFLAFYDKEIAIREELSLPPFGRLALLRFISSDEKEADTLSETAATILKPLLLGLPEGEAEALGPAPSPVSKLKDRHRRQIMLRTISVKTRHRILKSFIPAFRKKLPKGFTFTVDIDPYHLI
jgi:primosomal protein N' (replication factor Y)